MRVKQKILLLGSVVIILIPIINAIDNAHFYKAAHLHRSITPGHFNKGVKVEKENWLSKFDINYAYGNTDRCWNKSGKSAPLLNSTGDYDMLILAENVPSQKVPPSPIYMTAKFLEQFDNNTVNFGKLRFNGRFSNSELNFDWRQNLISGFFLEAHLPLRDVSIKHISYQDLSPDTGPLSKQMPLWVLFKNNIDLLLTEYGLRSLTTKYSKTSVGDLSAIIGWQGIWSFNKAIKYIGLTIKGNVLFPTGGKDDENYVFSLPIGYNDHYAVGLQAQFDLGIVKWLALSANGGFDYFVNDKNKARRMKTSNRQNGYIKLLKGIAEEEKGTLWHVGCDLKLDHFAKGFSVLVGYSYNRQEGDTLTPKDNTLFDKGIVNNDSLLNAWYMHVLHLMLDYDISEHVKKWHSAPRINLFYNFPFDGKNAFKTGMLGGGLGLDLRWKI